MVGSNYKYPCEWGIPDREECVQEELKNSYIDNI